MGCGPGFYVRELLDAVGPEGAVVGVDVSADGLAAAAERCAGFPNVTFLEAEATDLPVEDASFEAALSVQVLEYVADPGRALAELHRALRPGGRLVVWDVDWSTVSMRSTDEALTARVLHAWDEHLADPVLPGTLGAHLREAGFDDVRAEAHAFASTALDPERYGTAIVSLMEGFVVGREGITADEARAWGDGIRELDRRDEFFFACLQLCFSAVRP